MPYDTWHSACIIFKRSQTVTALIGVFSKQHETASREQTDKTEKNKSGKKKLATDDNKQAAL